MVCWKIHDLVRWCSMKEPPMNRVDFRLPATLTMTPEGRAVLQAGNAEEVAKCPRNCLGEPICVRGSEAKIEAADWFDWWILPGQNWPIICCVFKLLLLISFLLQYYCVYVYYYCYLFIVTTIYCYWYHYHYHYYFYYVIITLFLLSLYMKIYTYDVTM